MIFFAEKNPQGIFVEKIGIVGKWFFGMISFFHTGNC